MRRYVSGNMCLAFGSAVLGGLISNYSINLNEQAITFIFALAVIYVGSWFIKTSN